MMDEQLLWIAAIVIGLVVLLGVLRFALKLAMKFIAIGCALIVFLGLALAALYFLGILA